MADVTHHARPRRRFVFARTPHRADIFRFWIMLALFIATTVGFYLAAH